MKFSFLYFIVSLFILSSGIAQNKFMFDGQASFYGNLSPESNKDYQIGGNYIPLINNSYNFNSNQSIDIEGSANMYWYSSFDNFGSFSSDGKIDPYRIWIRYTSKQFELRAGLQKIDFGSSTLLRPLQWFNQIDPRDPLKLTNGVYGMLSRYYFQNNANIWLWLLYGNEKTRGFDLVKTNREIPEFGGRFQYPVTNGELAASYHHRTANLKGFSDEFNFSKIPEDRFSIDGKWDVVIGLWFEATHIHKHKNIGFLTDQTLLNIGADYTFSVGNGLNLIAEHMVITMDEKMFQFKNNYNISASTISYPIGLFDTVSSILYYSWKDESMSFFVNYQHQFKKISGYLMGYYNPKNQKGIQQNDLLNSFSGPGIRLMLVYNH